MPSWQTPALIDLALIDDAEKLPSPLEATPFDNYGPAS